MSVRQAATRAAYGVLVAFLAWACLVALQAGAGRTLACLVATLLAAVVVGGRHIELERRVDAEMAAERAAAEARRRLPRHGTRRRRHRPAHRSSVGPVRRSLR